MTVFPQLATAFVAMSCTWVLLLVRLRVVLVVVAMLIVPFWAFAYFVSIS